MSSIVYCDKFPNSPNGYLAVIDGALCTTGSEFLRCIWEQLKFPTPQYCNWDAYLDWMRDLSWLDAKNISIVITNYDLFLSKEPEYREFFIPDLEEAIFPFWENDAIYVFENQDYVKEIDIYCVQPSLIKNEWTAAEEVSSIIKRDILGGAKTPHSTSLPVLRMHNGELCFAAFLFYFNREEIQSGKCQRPSMWVIADLKTGKIIERYDCIEKEFSDASYDVKYDISADSSYNASKEYYEKLFNILDMVRIEFLETGKLNEELYGDYLKMLQSTTPKEYQRFYVDLSI